MKRFPITARPGIRAIAFVAALAAIFVLLTRLPAARIGDGAEYYAYEASIVTTKRPFVTEPGWEAYQRLISSGRVTALVDLDQMRRWFPKLRLSDTWDFNHFWAYPAAAAAFGSIFKSLGAREDPHRDFMALHTALLGLLVFVGWRGLGTAGAIAATFLIVGSPALWFVNKVHTEMLTVCLSTAAVALAMRKRYEYAAVCLAWASTQNISFAAPAGLAFILACWQQWGDDSASQGRIALAVAAVATTIGCLLNPAYFYFRYGVLTSQFLAGGADIHANSLKVAVNYLFDPDIGLFANWWAGWPLLAASAAAIVRPMIWRRHFMFLGFLASIAVANLFAQAAATNINSGGTVHVARYGLWYLCLFFPAAWGLARLIGRVRGKWGWIGAAIACILLIVNVRYFQPQRPEIYLAPTKLSRALYSRFPAAYDPNPEIFFERYSGLGEAAVSATTIVVGPDCRKLLAITVSGSATPSVVGRDTCGIAPDKFVDFVRRAQNGLDGAPGYRYLVLDRSELDASLQEIARGQRFGPEDAFSSVIDRGWGRPESWGVWSVEDEATLRFRLASDDENRDVSLALTLSAFLGEGRKEFTVHPDVNGMKFPAMVFNLQQRGPQTLVLNVPADRIGKARVVTIRLSFDRPVSPAELGLSGDTRRLGAGLIEFAIR